MNSKVKIGLGILAVVLIGGTVAAVLCLYHSMDVKVAKDEQSGSGVLYRVLLSHKTVLRKYSYNVSLSELLEKYKGTRIDPNSKWIAVYDIGRDTQGTKTLKATERMVFGGGRNWKSHVLFANEKFYNQKTAKEVANSLWSQIPDWTEESKTLKTISVLVANYTSQALVAPRPAPAPVTTDDSLTSF